MSNLSETEQLLARHAGRPNVAATASQIENMFELGFTVSQMASHYHISRPTVYKLLAEAGVEYSARYNTLSDSQLDSIITEIKRTHPNAGEINIMGHLRARGIQVQRLRVRASIHRVDPTGPSLRSARAFRHRIYETPCPNYVWHLDGNHKLVKWGFVTHLAIDGYTRLITFGRTSNNNQADTVLRNFNQAVEQYGRPFRVRTDHGGENVRVWQNMIEHRGPQSVICGSSVRNQRVERLNGDVNTQVNRFYAEIFRELEFEGNLDITNATDKFCLHYMYLPRVNKTLSEFVNAHNSHSISTEGGATPRQLMFAYQHLTEVQQLSLHSTSYPSVNVNDLLNRQEQLPYVEVLPSTNFLPNDKFDELKNLVNPLDSSSEKGKELYKQTIEFVGNFLLSQ